MENFHANRNLPTNEDNCMLKVVSAFLFRSDDEDDKEDGDVWWCMYCNRKEDDEDEEEEDFYKNYGVLAIGHKDEQEDIGFFYTIEEAIVEYKKVSLIDYMRVVIFESENYNPAEGGEFIIVKSRTKKVKKQIKLKLKK